MSVMQETDVAATMVQDTSQRLMLFVTLRATHISNVLSSPTSDCSGW